MLGAVDIKTGTGGDPLEGWSLPAWTYADPEFAAVEAERIFRPSWQIVCHASDVPNAGDWHSLDYIGESVIVVRGQDDVLRAFTNVCRHRGSRLVDGASGCAKKLVCPYHRWTYDLDGSLFAAGRMAPDFDKSAHGLRPVHLRRIAGILRNSKARELLTVEHAKPLAHLLPPVAGQHPLERLHLHRQQHRPAPNNPLLDDDTEEAGRTYLNHMVGEPSEAGGQCQHTEEEQNETHHDGSTSMHVCQFERGAGAAGSAGGAGATSAPRLDFNCCSRPAMALSTAWRASARSTPQSTAWRRC